MRVLRGGDDLVTVKEAAEILGVTVGYVYQFRKWGELEQASSGGRILFRRGDVMELLAQRSAAGLQTKENRRGPW